MITVQAGPSQIAEYQRLLVSEWKKSFPDEVLALLWSSVAPAASAEDSLRRLLDPATNGVFPVEYVMGLAQRIGDASRFAALQAELPPLPKDFEAKRFSRPAWQAHRLAVYLTLPAHVSLSGDVAFFRDVQSLAFQAALHFVLPALASKHPSEHALLLHTCALFPLEYHAIDPGHFYYLTSMVHGYLGHSEERLRFLYASFRVTRPEEHSFLTKAEELWAELLDLGRYEEAEKFLFSLHWWCLPSQQDEVRLMIVDALKVILSQDRQAS